MDAMTTPKLLLNQLERDFPSFSFASADLFSWLPEQKIIQHPNLSTDEDIARLFHELSHGVLNHANYSRDIQLIDMEREAWEYATQEVAPKYDFALSMDDDVVQDALDTYREWLHKRSLCPKCGAVGLEFAQQRYRCLNCQSEWKVNEAKRCQLRRYLLA